MKISGHHLYECVREFFGTPSIIHSGGEIMKQVKQRYIMHRFGSIVVPNSVPTQCKSFGHTNYSYEVILECDNKLDSDGFVIDHIHVDRAVQKTAKKVSSCENMCATITTDVYNLLKRRGVRVFEIHVILKPIPSSMSKGIMAYMELKTKYE